MDLTFLVARETPTHPLADEARNRVFRGDIVDVFAAGRLPPVSSVPRFWHVHITGFPDGADGAALKSAILGQTMSVIDGLPVRQRDWKLDVDGAYGTGFPWLAQLEADQALTVRLADIEPHVWNAELGRALDLAADFGIVV